MKKKNKSYVAINENKKSECARQVRKTNEITVNSQTRFYTSLYQTPKRATAIFMKKNIIRNLQSKAVVSGFCFQFEDQCFDVKKYILRNHEHTCSQHHPHLQPQIQIRGFGSSGQRQDAEIDQLQTQKGQAKENLSHYLQAFFLGH